MLLVTNVINIDTDTYSADLRFRDRRNITKVKDLDVVIDPGGNRFTVSGVPFTKVQGMTVTLTAEVPGASPVFSTFYDATIEEYTDINFADKREELIVTAGQVGVKPLTVSIPNDVKYVPGSGDLEVFLNGQHLLKGAIAQGYTLEEFPGNLANQVYLDGTRLSEGDSILFIKEKVRIARRFIK